MVLREIGCDNGRLIGLAEDHVPWWAFLLVALELQVLLPQKQYLCYKFYPNPY
jgi:hypothetical protein